MLEATISLLFLDDPQKEAKMEKQCKGRKRTWTERMLWLGAGIYSST